MKVDSAGPGMSVAPVSQAAAVVRAEILGAAESGLLTALAATPSKTIPAPDAVQRAVAEARAALSGRQASLAPLFADLGQALDAPGLPAPLRTAMSQVLARQLPGNGPFTAETIRRALLQSGLFLEAQLATGQPAPQPDLKAALLVLQRMLEPRPKGSATHGSAAETPPPVRDGALSAHPAARPSLAGGAETPAILQLLRHEVDQALARHTLHQLASRPDGSTSAWMFELPIATPQGAAVAQFEIERDHHSSAAERTEAWRARFSIDVEPLGPVHVHLVMGGEQPAVTVWAEREGSADLLRSHEADLARELAGHVVVRPGAPARSPPLPGAFVDQAT